MILDVTTGLRGLLIDQDTGQPIRWAYWANTDTGQYKAYRMDPVEAKRLKVPLQSVAYRGRGRLKFVPSVLVGNKSAPQPQPAPEPSKPVEPDVRRKVERCLVLDDRPCEHYGCLRNSEWKVAIARDLPPEILPDGRRFSRGEVVEVNYFCSWHFRTPQTLHPDGSTSPIEVKARPD